MHLPHLIIDLALILAVAAIVGILFKFLKQPVVLGYIIAGLVVGPYTKFLPTVFETASIKTWAEIGVIILLFNLGLEFSFKKLIKEGNRIVIVALFGVTLTLFTGYFLGKLLGWNDMDSIFMGGILSIASTTIIIRAFDELGVKTQKFTNNVTSILVVEDLVAVVLMVILSTISISREFQGMELLFSILKLMFFLVLWFVSGIFFLPTLLKVLKRILNEEMLLILSLALCFLIVILALKAGFSPAFGAFIMGSILAETTKAEKIEQLISPLKNLFGAIFFVSVGMLLNPDMIIEYIVPISLSVLVLLIGKPIFIILGSLVTGQPLRIAIQTGMSLSQIGEFSFIIATLGLTLNVISDFLYPVAVTVSVLTTFTTPYMIKYAEKVFVFAESVLPHRWQQLLTNYSIGAEKIRDVSEWRKLVRQTVSNSIIFSVIIVTIILVNTKILQPYLMRMEWGTVITAVITIILISPFLWALAFRRPGKNVYNRIWLDTQYRGHLIILQVSRISLAIFYNGFLFNTLFSPEIALIGVAITIVVVMLFSKKIQSIYGIMEDQFLTNLNARNEKSRQTAITPWDTHLSKIKLHANVPFIGKSLLEARIREDYGVNIAVIERDEVTINVPGRHERLYPHDVISVIGTDEQLKKFKDYIEASSIETKEKHDKNAVKLMHFTISSNSQLLGKSIKDSNIREITKGLVVGIERGGDKILNPESNIVFLEGDMVWIVGNSKRILVLTNEEQA